MRIGRGWVLPMCLAVVLAAAVSLWFVRVPASPHPSAARRATGGGSPARPAMPPTPSPALFADVTPEAAQEINANVPFVTTPNVPARPFQTSLTDVDRERAIGCLAAAAYYEAGDDAVGERAVIQVVLNRVRHPAFARSICGVVFEGSERVTGCQFTFTCDGSLDRRAPVAAAWARARAIATAGLSGTVFRPVGLATHYHTNWVVPYWSGSLDKITAVHTHLFYRWRGYWGTRAAFAAPYSGPEPAVTRLARLMPAEAGAAGVVANTGAVEDVSGQGELAPSTDAALVPLAANPSVFLLSLPIQRQEEYERLANRACGKLQKCRVFVWTGSDATPTALPLSTRDLASLSFSYVRDREVGFERVFRSCALDAAQTRCAGSTR